VSQQHKRRYESHLNELLGDCKKGTRTDVMLSNLRSFLFAHTCVHAMIYPCLHGKEWVSFQSSTRKRKRSMAVSKSSVGECCCDCICLL
jgi:hypothetical protein